MESDPEDHQAVIASLKLDKEKTLKVRQVYNHVVSKMKITNARFQNPVTLNRFLMAKSYNVDKAIKMFEDYLKWRHDNKIDQLIEGDLSNLPVFKRLYPKAYYYKDKQGHPLIIEQIGKAKLGELFKKFDYDAMCRIVYFNYELIDRVLLPACSKIEGRPITQVTAILDMKGIGITDLMSKNVYNMVSIASKMVQEYYPEIVFKSFIINTPMLFSTFFNLVKPLLNSRTQASLSLPGGKFKKELAEAIDLQYLPIELGGTNPNIPGDGIDRGDYVEYLQMAIQSKSWDVVHPPSKAEEKGLAAAMKETEDEVSIEAEKEFIKHSHGDRAEPLSKVDALHKEEEEKAAYQDHKTDEQLKAQEEAKDAEDEAVAEAKIKEFLEEQAGMEDGGQQDEPVAIQESQPDCQEKVQVAETKNE